ncbi:hypothetical protein HPB48_010097 [Haemaphysalis longicornis]|uniref:Carboxylic ester hydrolase n=1 Tax=Haemaphysalis longicornis TaxID=44386 RepID=A0A9J6FZY4_HAELO|nr:hypothetical protein HPB48_010097 [Haemaphysalis longicornis]
MFSEVFLLSLIICCVAGAERKVTVSTSQGLLSGKAETVQGKAVEAYLGIPYAQPPIGNLRFRKPVPLKSWNGTYDGSRPKHACIQTRFKVIFNVPTDLSEDCLYLNVWTPGRDEPLKPVLVWIHGGAFKFGSSHERWYDGSAMAALNDVVFVSMEYRLGIFGFLDYDDNAAPGNMGLWDQHLALKWVKQNIRNFGGDPGLVTVFGESAGSYSVHGHMLSPHSKGLFKRAFMLSGTFSTNMVLDSVSESIEKGNRVAQLLGCGASVKNPTKKSTEALECLRTKEADALHRASEEATGTKIVSFQPTFKNEFLPKLPSLAGAGKRYEPLDALISVTADEGAFAAVFQPDQRWLVEELTDFDDDTFKKSAGVIADAWSTARVTPHGRVYVEKAAARGKKAARKAVIEFIGDVYFRCPTIAFCEQHSKAGGKVYPFVFGYRSDKYEFPKFFGVPHTSDVPYYTGTPFLDPENFTDKDRDVSRKAMELLVSFAKTG